MSFSDGSGIHQCFEERLPIRAGQDHALVLIQHPACALIGKVARGQASDSHGALDQLLSGGPNAQFDPFAFDFAVRFPTI